LLSSTSASQSSPTIVRQARWLPGEKDGKHLIGYWLGVAHWGRGIATEALAQLLASHRLSRPVFASAALSNARSIRVLEKCGFRRAAVGTREGVEEALMELGR
jgi:RimJ/RimL family protein N-acetyltransferase